MRDEQTCVCRGRLGLHCCVNCAHYFVVSQSCECMHSVSVIQQCGRTVQLAQLTQGPGSYIHRSVSLSTQKSMCSCLKDSVLGDGCHVLIWLCFC